MKKHLLLLSTLFLSVGSLFNSCKKADDMEQITLYHPIYKSKYEVRSAIKSSAISNITEAGKIFIKDDYLFLVDVNKGIHLINIKNMSRPQQVAFIPIPGCVDIAVRGNFFYADCGKDLVTVDIRNPLSATLKKVIPNVFTEKYYYGKYGYAYTTDTTKMLSGWEKIDTLITKVKYDPSLTYINSATFASNNTTSATTNGVGGSTSRFGLLNDRMYAVSNSDLKVFNTADASSPTFVNKLNLNQGNIETIFPYKDNLFIGSQNGMYIYNTANPDNPSKLTQFTHVRSCDPVIADQNTAYVTLHGGSSCGGFSNQLDVLDITSLTNPAFIKTYALTSPRGLAKDGKLLLVCDGSDGLKIFNAANAQDIWLIKQVRPIDAQDVIAYKGFAVVTTTKGLFFVDYRDAANAKVVHVIQVGKS